jgi:hypothetical protein
MTRVLGMLAGVGILVMAGFTFQDSAAGWAGGHSDIGFWWAVITVFLAIAGFGAIIGTWIHTQPVED